MSASDSLIDLPDRPALEQLTRALWSRGTMRGAAVLVGAGVSRGGVRLLSNDAPLPPLWSHLAKDMARELYGAQSANAPSDPLRLAEEFRAGLGDAALADFLRRRIRDDALEPGQIHRDLLDLPWADVLTTNYDTLLERAAKEARRGYDVVLTENDLAHAGGPRIIKLHGSLRDGAGIVISEEDYRSYPQRQAAFVNTTRQIFIENELCLLGFSGDDPNFLQWAGWVRDRLGGQARRIYLVGALQLPPVKRRLLESRGITPIDIASAVKGERADQRHATAISLFLAHLKAARPAEPDDWKPTSYRNYTNLRQSDHDEWVRDFNNPEKAVETLRKALAIWRADRHTCPDWLICPPTASLSVIGGIDTATNISLALDNLPEDERLDALLELAWRYDRAAQPLPSHQVERMNAILTSERLAEFDLELVTALARRLLEAARSADDETVFEACVAGLETLAAPNDLPALIAHERCLFACDRLDFAFVAENIDKVDGDDPIWGLRRAALYFWIGEVKQANRTIGAAARELRVRVLRDPDSVALRSRLAWAKMLARALRWEDEGALFAELDGLDRFALRDYDPWEQLRALDSKIDDGLRKRLEAREIEPNFDAGTYRDNRNTVVIESAAQVTPLSKLRYIAERVGLPVRTRHGNLLGTRLADALRLSFKPTARWYAAFLSTRPSYSKGPIDIHLGRIAIARLDPTTASELRSRIENAVKFWRERVRASDRSSDADTLRLYVEALSRLSARNNADASKAHARLALELGTNESLRHWWLNEPIGHLLKRSVDAIFPDERSELSSELLRFPLAVERDASGPEETWYNPGRDVYHFVRRSGNEALFDARVAVFLHHLAPGGFSRPEAALRLFYLHQNNQLTQHQIASFADALWRGIPQDTDLLPDATNLLPHAFLVAPAPSEIDVRKRIYAYLFKQNGGVDPAYLVAAASGRTPSIQPSEEDAARLFDGTSKWRPTASSPDSIGDAFTRPLLEEHDRMMASILGVVTAPALAKHDRTVERAELALQFLDETNLPESLAALPVFYGLNAEIDTRIIDAFRRPLASGDLRVTPAVVDALDRWLNLSKRNLALDMPDVLRDRALRALERGRTNGLSNLIYLARRLIEAERCAGPELDRIVEVLDELRAATDYGSPGGDANMESAWAISLPLVRAECVRLARELENKGVTADPVHAWLNLSINDPLPEVRNSAQYMSRE